jgi:hypothetical protein
LMGTTAAGEIVTEKLPDAFPFAAMTFSVSAYVPACIGVPESVPFVASASPGGSELLESENVVGAVPFALKTALYA